jgi:hypothetical protein
LSEIFFLEFLHVNYYLSFSNDNSLEKFSSIQKYLELGSYRCILFALDDNTAGAQIVIKEIYDIKMLYVGKVLVLY